MDANGTRFHAVWGHAGDWRRVLPAVADAEVTGGAVRLKARTPEFGAVGELKLTPADRRGAARDRFGNWYAIGASGRAIVVQPADGGPVATVWPPPEEPRPGPFAPRGQRPTPGRLAGLAVTRHHALVAGALDPPGLLAFDLVAGGPPRRVAAPAGTAFAPFDVSALGDGVVVLDRDHHTAWAFDRDLAPRPVDAAAPAPARFQPKDPASARREGEQAPAAGVALPAGWPKAVAVEAMTCDKVWTLHEPTVDPATPGVAATGSKLAAVDWAGAKPVTAAPAFGTDVASELRVGGTAVGGHDLALATPDGPDVDPEDRPARLEVALADGKQAVAFTLADLTPRPDYLPLRRFGGQAYSGPAPGSPPDVRPGYDSAGRWVESVVVPRPRHATTVTLTLPGPNGWDGKAAGCVWHRLFLDACLPPGCSVTVKAEVSEDRATWSKPVPQPNPIRRPGGSELPFAPALPAGFGTWETLLHKATGRYLRLTLTLTGDGERTPRVRAVRAWYPRFSYLERYLPAIYRDDPTSADFLERFLANAEGTLTGIEDKIVAARALIDPRTAPADALDWLAGWLGLAASPGWDEARRRAFLRHAPELLRRRGTVRGLQWALHLALDPVFDERVFAVARTDTSPYRVVETFRRRAAPAVVLGDPTELDRPRPVVSIPGAKWTPEDGPASLNARYAAAGLGPAFPLCPPADADRWAAFARDTLGFVPEARPGDPDDEARWADFLRRRGRPVEPLPDTLDIRPSRFADWLLFETGVMAAARAAHRFEVLIPTVTTGPRGELPTVSPSPADLARSRERLALAEQVVRREAPAHCRFAVRLYAAAFRVGGSRVGADIVLGLGSRSPELDDDLVLGAAFAGEAFLRPRPPADAPGRITVGDTPAFRAAARGGRTR